MKKLLKFIASILPVLVLLPVSVGATVVDSCGQTFDYLKNGDFNDSRVHIDFINTTSPGNPDTITVTAEDGYVVTHVELDVAGDGIGGFTTYSSGALIDFNPNPGTNIDGVKVTVKKVCPDVCPNLEGDQYTIPEGYVVEEGQCVLPPPPPTDLCANIEGVQESVPEGLVQDGDNCVEPPPPPPVTDVCPNIEGDQATIPDGYHDVDGQCIQDEVVVPPVTPPVDTGSSHSNSGGSGTPGGASVWRRLCNISGFCVLNPDPMMAPIASQILDIWMQLFKLQSSLK